MNIQQGILVDFTQILNIISKFFKPDSYGVNDYTYYYGAIFRSSSIINNVPVIYLTSPNEYITLEITIPSGDYLDNVNLINITPYFYNYNTDVVFGSIDTTISFFNPKPQAGQTIKIVFTSSKLIGDNYKNLGYIVSKIPAEYLSKTNFLFLVRVGNLTGTYNPGQLVTYSKVELHTITTQSDLIPYNSKEIISSFPIPLNSELFYTKPLLLEKLLELYNNTINYYLGLNYTQIPTYLYLQNYPTPPVSYPFESFYDAISVDPPINLQGNNTEESYFNSAMINLADYTGKQIYVISVNQYSYKYGLYSNIQFYNNDNLSVIPNTSYQTSPPIPAINNSNYPNPNSNDSQYPLINTSIFDINTFISQNISQILIVERIGYNPINFSHSNDYIIPRFNVFITN